MRRKLFETLKLHLDKKEFTILTGARQTGKTTLLRQLEDYCKTTLKIPCVFLNLENKMILSELNNSPLNLLNFLPVVGKKCIVFIDEIQYLNDPSNFLKLIYDEHAERIKIVATGSSAFYIDRRFQDSLTGRKRVFKLPTCSFDEYLHLTGKDDLLSESKRIISDKAAKTAQIQYLRNEWETYMLFGGYPAVVTEPDRSEKIARLREIRDSYVKRDALESGVRDDTSFHNLFRIIAGQCSGILNVNELSVTLRIKNETVDHYLFLLQKCFHIALIRPFYRNLRKELVKMPKVFVSDTGLRNCLVNDFQNIALRSDKGALWENMYFKLLADKYDVEEINYWRTTDGAEVDFVLPGVDQPFAVEVKFDEHAIKRSKYKKFEETYLDIPLHYAWMEPFNEDFFRRMYDTFHG